MIYRSKDGDVVDLICARHYDGQPYRVEAVFDANPGLASHGPVLPAGVLIVLPETVAQPRSTIRLWD